MKKEEPIKKEQPEIKANSKVEKNQIATSKSGIWKTAKDKKNQGKSESKIIFLKDKLEKLTLEIGAIKDQLASEEKAIKEKMPIEKEAIKFPEKEKLIVETVNNETITNDKIITEMEQIDYKKIDDFINSQSRLNKWFDRKIEYSGNETSIVCDDIPVLREWESGKSGKGIAFTRLENKLGLVQLKNDGVIGLLLSPMLDERYSLHANDEQVERIKEALEKSNFEESNIIMAFGGGVGFDWGEIIKPLSDKYSIQFIEKNLLKRKWFVEIVTDNSDDKKDNKPAFSTLKFIPIGQ